MNRLLVALFWVLASSCIDTSIPDLSRELGEGRTDGPFCNPSEVDEFPPETLRMTLIDVGQGDAIWIQTPYFDNQELESLDILIDVGSAGRPGVSPGGATVVDYLLDHRADQFIDALVITHAHEDHFGGIAAVANAFEIGRYIDPGFIGTSPTFLSSRAKAVEDVNRLGGLVQFPAVPQLTPRTNVQTDLFGPFVDATLLWSADVPPSGNTSSPSGTDINNTSVVFAISWKGQQILLLGDAEAEVEAKLAEMHDAGEFNMESAVLKVAHHGSNSSSDRGFLARVFPSADAFKWAVISSGKVEFFGVQLPTENTLLNLAERLEPNHILSTENRDDIKDAGSEHGDDHIMVTIDAEGFVWACYVQANTTI